MASTPVKLEIGGSHNRVGWVNLDHKADRPGGKRGRFNIMLDALPVPDNHLELVYMSNVLEHIPLLLARPVLKKICCKLKPGGILRLAVPDLRQAAAAYLRGDKDFFERARPSIGDVFRGLGDGGLFMSCLVSYGADTLLFDNTGKHKLAGLAHVGLYDYEMLAGLALAAGFSSTQTVQPGPLDHQNTVGQLFVEAVR